MSDTSDAAAPLLTPSADSRYRALLSMAPCAMCRLGPDGRLLDANPALAAMLGYETSDALLVRHQACTVFGDPLDGVRLTRVLSETGHIEGLETAWKHRSGSILTIRLSGRAVYTEQGELECYEATGENITERRRLESRVRQAESMETVGQLAGGIAHHFNNLLTAILGYTELLLARHVGELDRNDLQEIQKAGQRAALLTRQLLAFSRRQVSVPRKVDLNYTVDQLHPILTRLMRDDVTLTVELAPASAWLMFDPHLLEQVILNLFLNARDAVLADGHIRLEVAHVELAPSQLPSDSLPAGPYIRLRVVDDGMGIRADTHDPLFEPFFTTKEHGKGSGLGLPTVRGIVRQSNGWVNVESESGRGTTVTVHLPALSDRDLDPEPAERGPEVSGEHAGRGEAILLVDDEEAVRRITGALLRQHGYRVLEASRSEEALTIFETHHAQFDLLLTDILVPGGLSGPALAQRLVTLCPTLRVLFISGYSSPWPVEAFRPNTGFLAKPFQMAALLGKVHEMLARTVHNT